MRYLIPLLLMCSCGPKVHLDGKINDVTVKHTVDVEGLDKYIRAFCSMQFSDPDDIENCVNAEIGKLLSKL